MLASVSFDMVNPPWRTFGAWRSADSAPDVTNHEPLGERIGRIDEILTDPINPGLAGDGRHDGRIRADAGFLDQPPGEGRAKNAFVDKVRVERETTLRVQGSHFCAGARST